MADYPVTLHDGTYDGETVDVGEPWPRYSTFPVTIDDGPEEFYLARETGPPYDADYVDVAELPDETFPEGEPGPTGPTGPDGPAGPEGPAGEPGQSVAIQGAWEDDVTYDYAAIVTHDGSSWISTVSANLANEPDTTGPASALWTQLTTGVPGPQGPPGLNNGVYSDIWSWTTNTSAASTSGQIGLNQTTWAAATQLNVNQQTKDGRDVSTLLFPRLATGDQFYLQQKTDATRYAYFTVSGAPTDNGTWWSIPVTFNSGGGAVPGGTTDTNVSLLKTGPSANSVPVQDEGTDLTTRARLNFVGSGVTATDDSANDRTLVTIAGGGGATGAMVWAGAWTSGATYDENDVVSYASHLYIAPEDMPAGVVPGTTPAPPPVTAATPDYSAQPHEWIGTAFLPWSATGDTSYTMGDFFYFDVATAGTITVDLQAGGNAVGWMSIYAPGGLNYYTGVDHTVSRAVGRHYINVVSYGNVSQSGTIRLVPGTGVLAAPPSVGAAWTLMI